MRSLSVAIRRIFAASSDYLPNKKDTDYVRDKMKSNLYCFWFLAVFAIIVINALFIINQDSRGIMRGSNSRPKFDNVFLNEKYQNCSSLPRIPFISSFQSDWYNISSRGEVAIYSAYLEGINVLKIIGIAEDRELSPFCQMWTQTEGGMYALVSVHEARVIFLPEAHKKRYITFSSS